jgi:hypothetical protein
MSTTHRYGNTGLLAKVVFDNFEVCLMLVAAFLLGGMMTSVVAAGSSIAVGLLFTTSISVGIGLTVVAAELFIDGY